MSDNPIDLENADLLLSTTRAVRRRLDLERPVPREVILECVRLAVQAPTASNGQTWRWMIVTLAAYTISLMGKVSGVPFVAASPREHTTK
jgi:nitroreductase